MCDDPKFVRKKRVHTSQVACVIPFCPKTGELSLLDFRVSSLYAISTSGSEAARLVARVLIHAGLLSRTAALLVRLQRRPPH